MQEAITNARRHSGCSSITVHLKFADDAVNLDVQDDGHGLLTLQHYVLRLPAGASAFPA